VAGHRGLGKGFDALIPTDFDQSILLDDNERIQKLFIKDIHPNSQQPRKHFAEDSLQELAASIKRYGILQPLIVSRDSDGYQIIAGERRWRAAGLAGLDRIPAVVRAAKDHERLEMALIENVQRVDLSPLEQAVSIERLHQQFNVTYADIAERLGKGTSTITNIVRLLQLPPEARDALQDGEISEGHARTVLSLKEQPKKQLELLAGIIKFGWSVRQAEQFVVASRNKANDKQHVQKHMASETAETQDLSRRLQLPVSLRWTARGGRLEIHFKDDDQLKNVLGRLGQL